MKKILVIAGASGVGKTTILTRLLEDHPEFMLVRSATTRAPRGDGHDGEYVYTDRGGFMKLVEDGKMLEYMEYGGNLYGTPLSELSRIFDSGKTPALILDLVGVKSLRAQESDFTAKIYYIDDDPRLIERRLYNRFAEGGMTEEKLQSYNRRIAANLRDRQTLAEMSHMFDAIVKNCGIVETAEKLVSLFYE